MDPESIGQILELGDGLSLRFVIITHDSTDCSQSRRLDAGGVSTCTAGSLGELRAASWTV